MRCARRRVYFSPSHSPSFIRTLTEFKCLKTVLLSDLILYKKRVSLTLLSLSLSLCRRVHVCEPLILVLENSVAYLVELFFNDKVFIAFSIFSSPYFFSFSLSLYKSLSIPVLENSIFLKLVLGLTCLWLYRMLPNSGKSNSHTSSC